MTAPNTCELARLGWAWAARIAADLPGALPDAFPGTVAAASVLVGADGAEQCLAEAACAWVDLVVRRADALERAQNAADERAYRASRGAT